MTIPPRGTPLTAAAGASSSSAMVAASAASRAACAASSAAANGGRGGLGRSRSRLPGGGGCGRRGVGCGLCGGSRGGGVLGARLPRGLSGRRGGIGGRLRDGGGARVAGRPGRVGGIGGGFGRRLGGSGRLFGVIGFGRFGRQGGGRLGGFGGAARGIGGRARGLGGGGRVARGRVDRRRIDGGRRSVIVVVAAADEGQPGGPNARLGACSQHGAARYLSLSQTRPIVAVASWQDPSWIPGWPHVGRPGTEAAKD